MEPPPVKFDGVPGPTGGQGLFPLLILLANRRGSISHPDQQGTTESAHLEKPRRCVGHGGTILYLVKLLPETGERAVSRFSFRRFLQPGLVRLCMRLCTMNGGDGKSQSLGPFEFFSVHVLIEDQWSTKGQPPKTTTKMLCPSEVTDHTKFPSQRRLLFLS